MNSADYTRMTQTIKHQQDLATQQQARIEKLERELAKAKAKAAKLQQEKVALREQAEEMRRHMPMQAHEIKQIGRLI